MVEWRIYGCGSPSSSLSTQSSYEISDGDNRLHIDIGHGGLYHRCLREGSIEAAINAIKNILITHSHPDHYFDLARLYVAWMYTPGFKPQNRVSLYATSDTMHEIKKVMINARLEGGFEKVFDTHIIDIDKPVKIDGFTVTAKTSHHIEGSNGVWVETPSGKNIGFTSDTGFNEDLLSIWKDIDLFITECCFVDLETPYHLHLGQVQEMAGKINPECLLMVHFYPDMERLPNEDILKAISQKYQGTTYIGHDGLLVKWDAASKTWITEDMF
jgi:ribonuclease BN (tRNA processing enzyme)